MAKKSKAVRCSKCGAIANICQNKNVSKGIKGAWHVFCIYCQEPMILQWKKKSSAIKAWNTWHEENKNRAIKRWSGSSSS